MTKREINLKYGFYTESFSKEIDVELDRVLTEDEAKDYDVYVQSFINYIQSDLKK